MCVTSVLVSHIAFNWKIGQVGYAEGKWDDAIIV